MVGTADSVFARFYDQDSLPVFADEDDEGRSFTVAPRFNHGRLRWAVRVTDGSRVLYEDIQGLSADAAERFGVEPAYREHLNDLRQFVHRKFDDVPVKGNRQLNEHPLSALEEAREEYERRNG